MAFGRATTTFKIEQTSTTYGQATATPEIEEPAVAQTSQQAQESLLVDDFEADAVNAGTQSALNNDPVLLGEPAEAIPPQLTPAPEVSVNPVDTLKQAIGAAGESALGSTVKTLDEIEQALTEAQKVDLSITLRSKRSESIEFNTLKVPQFRAEFLYNFFDENEEDLQTQENPRLDPLLKNRPVDVPRYADINWAVAKVTEPLRGTRKQAQKNQKLRRDVFARPRGRFSYNSQNVPFSMQNNRKNMEDVHKDGLRIQVADIHEPERAFEATANSTEFPNTVSVTLNTSTQRSVTDRLPYSNVKK